MRGIFHVFPFQKIGLNTDIVIFGLGVVGEEYIAQIQQTNFCNLKYIIDNNCGLEQYQGIQVVNTLQIKQKLHEFDKVVIAIGNEEQALKISNDLKDIGVSADKIVYESKTTTLSIKCIEDIMGDICMDREYCLNLIRPLVNENYSCLLDLIRPVMDENCSGLQSFALEFNNVISRLPFCITNGKKKDILLQLRDKFCNSNKENLLDTTRLIMLYQNIINVVQSVEGNMAEIGVYKGDTASILAHFCKEYDRQLFLFDTFQGFAEQDLVGIDQLELEDYRDASLQQVKNIVGMEHNIHYIKGYFPESITKQSEQSRYCLVHIDCDLYKPIKSALSFFWNRLNDGGIIIVHDYSSMYWKGATQAVEEFCKENRVVPVLMPDLSGSVILVKQ